MHRRLSLRATHRRIALATCLLASLPLASCEPSNEPELETLRVSFTRRLTMAPLMIAQQRGFFAEQGLDVQLMAIESASVGIPSLLQGKLDVLPGPVSAAFFNAINRGGRVRVVGDKGVYDRNDCSHNGMVVSASARQVDGRPVIERYGTTKEHFLQFLNDRFLRTNGYDPEQIDVMHLPPAAEYDALMNGRLDAAWVSEPWLSRIRDNGGATIHTLTNDLFDQYQYSVILYGPSLLDDRPDLGERFMVALVQGLQAYNEGKTEQNLAIVADLMKLNTEELTDICWPSMSVDGYVNTASLEEFEQWAVDREELDAVVPAAEFWEPRFVEHAKTVLGTGK